MFWRSSFCSLVKMSNTTVSSHALCEFNLWLCVFSPFRCKVCPLTFFSKSDMQIHSKSHTEAKPHKCPHCTKSFANASYLAQHLRIHLGVKPYHCSYCEKSFRQLSHLQQHTRWDQKISGRSLWAHKFFISGIKLPSVVTRYLLLSSVWSTVCDLLVKGFL